MLDPLRSLVATREIHFVLNRLAVLDQRFAHINEKYDWDSWSADFECQVYQALWSNSAEIPCVPPQIPLDNRDKKVDFLRGFGTMDADEVRIPLSSRVLFFKRFRRGTGKRRVGQRLP
jgi:hypothetical protein